MTEAHQKIVDVLFGAVREGESLYAILDAARNVEIAYKVQNAPNLEYVSLYKGRKEEPYWDAAPYLVRSTRDSEIFNWVIDLGWGNSWGVFLTSGVGLQEIHNHLQQFILVQTEDDKEYYFRFYDPRVLRVFLPTCKPEEARHLFGPATQFLMESNSLNILLRFIPTQRWAEQHIISA